MHTMGKRHQVGSHRGCHTRDRLRTERGRRQRGVAPKRGHPRQGSASPWEGTWRQGMPRVPPVPPGLQPGLDTCVRGPRDLPRWLRDPPLPVGNRSCRFRASHSGFPLRCRSSPRRWFNLRGLVPWGHLGWMPSSLVAVGRTVELRGVCLALPIGVALCTVGRGGSSESHPVQERMGNGAVAFWWVNPRSRTVIFFHMKLCRRPVLYSMGKT